MAPAVGVSEREQEYSGPESEMWPEPDYETYRGFEILCRHIVKKAVDEPG